MHCTLTLEELQEIVEAFCEIRVSSSTLSNYIGSFRYTLKRFHVKAAAADTDILWEERRNFSRWFLDSVLQRRKLVFVDETGFQVVTRASRGRSKSGERAEITAPGIRSRNITCIAGITSESILH